MIRRRTPRKRQRRRLQESGGGITLSPSSVDTQIDSLLTTFENESMEAEDDIMPEGISMRAAINKLFEAPEDDEEMEGEPGDADELEDEAVTDDEQKTDEPADPLTPKINLDEFAEKVAMLIETYTKRLDIETVIFNRAKNYLEKHHGEDVAREFEDVLVTDHDIDLRNKAHAEDEPVAPPAMGAGPAI